MPYSEFVDDHLLHPSARKPQKSIYSRVPALFSIFVFLFLSSRLITQKFYNSVTFFSYQLLLEIPKLLGMKENEFYRANCDTVLLTNQFSLWNTKLRFMLDLSNWYIPVYKLGFLLLHQEALSQMRLFRVNRWIIKFHIYTRPYMKFSI